jgi:hypothetical protein
MVERRIEATGLWRRSAKVDRGPGSRRKEQERRKRRTLGSARGVRARRSSGLVSSIDEAATGTDGIVDERAGYCATRYGSAIYRVREGGRRLTAVYNCCALSRASNGDGGSIGLIFLHKIRALVEREESE